MTLRPTSPPAQPPVNPPSSLSCAATKGCSVLGKAAAATAHATHREHLLVALDVAALANVDVVRPRQAAVRSSSTRLLCLHTAPSHLGCRLGRPLLQRLLSTCPAADEAPRVASLDEQGSAGVALVAIDMGPSYGKHHAPEAYWGPPQYTCPCRRTPSRAWRTRERWRKRRGGYGRSVSLLEATRGATRSPPQRCLQALSDPGARARQCMFTRGRRRSARSGSGCTASCTHRLARDLPWHRRAAAQGRATSGAGAATKAMALWNRPCERASDGQKSRPLEFRM